MSQRNTADDLGTIRPMFRVDAAAMGGNIPDILGTGEHSLPYLLKIYIILAKKEQWITANYIT